MRTLKIGKNDCEIRLDKFLGKYFPTMPKTLMYKYIRQKCVKRNNARIKENDILHEGDVLTFYISDEFFGVPRTDSFLRIKPSVTVVYEDENILVADKPAGLIVHSDDKEEFNTLINHIKAYLYSKAEYDPETENSFAPALCNRIDRNTSGLVIAAKNAAALKIMNDKIKNREITKKYLCAAHGIFQKPEGVLTAYIEKLPEENRVSLSSVKTKNGKIAITEYRVLKTNEVKKLSLLEVVLVTGRTHQIRAQLAAEGHPLLGDGKYAENKEDRKHGFSYQALSAHSLRFNFNTSEKTALDYLNGRCFTASEPDFLNLFDKTL